MIAKEEYIDNQIIINFETVCKWLNVKKEKLKPILINNFLSDFDYSIKGYKKK